MWIPDANVSRDHTDVLTVINYYRMLATGMDVVLFPPVRLSYGGKSDCMVYPNVGVIVRRNGPRQICIKNHDHQVSEGPPNFVLEMESKHGFTNLGKNFRYMRLQGYRRHCSWRTANRRLGTSFEWGSSRFSGRSRPAGSRAGRFLDLSSTLKNSRNTGGWK